MSYKPERALTHNIIDSKFITVFVEMSYKPERALTLYEITYVHLLQFSRNELQAREGIDTLRQGHPLQRCQLR